MDELDIEAAPRDKSLAEKYLGAQEATDLARRRLDSIRRELDAAQKDLDEAVGKEQAIWADLAREASSREAIS